MFRGENIGSFDVPVNDTLLVKEQETTQHLCSVATDEVLREFAKVLADVMQTAILAVLQYDVEVLCGLQGAVILDDIRVVEVLQEINLLRYDVQLRLWQICEADLLYGDSLACAPVQSSKDRAKGALSEAVS